MNATFASYFSSCKRTEGRRDGAFAVFVVLLAVAGSILTEGRSVSFVGFGPNPAWFVPYALLLILAALSREAPPIPEMPRWSLVFSVGLLTLPFLPPGLAAAVAFAAFAGMAACVPRLSAFARRAALVSIALGWVEFVRVGVSWISVQFDLSQPLARLLGGFYGLLGAKVAVAGASVVLDNGQTRDVILASLDKFGGAGFACLLAAAGLLAFLQTRSWRAVGLVLGGVTAYGFVRAVVVMRMCLEQPIGNWMNDDLTLLSFAPLAVVAVMYLPTARPAVEEDSGARPRRLSGFAAIAVALGAFALAFGWSFAAPGERKAGTVVIDQRYSDWEWIDEDLGTRRYGTKTVYSYSDMVKALGHYYPVRINRGAIDEASLRDASVLILKTPTEPYPESAIRAIHRFVARGGGLWLVGDHTDIFGMDSYLNQVAKPYGLRFNANAVADEEGQRQLYRPSGLKHPIVRDMPLFLWYTSDTIDAPVSAENVVLSPRLLIDDPDFSVNTFFGDFQPSPNEPIGPVLQAAAVAAGKGRVAVWSDSTLFSNFSIFMPGKMETALGYVDWLNRANGVPWRFVLVGIGGALLLAGLVRARPCEAGLLAVAGVALAFPAHAAALRMAYPAVEPKTPFDRVAFWETSKISHFPTLVDPQEPTPESYLTAFIACQRVGRRPFLTTKLDEALSVDTIVVPQMQTELSYEEAKRLREWVEKGGRLIVLDSGQGFHTNIPLVVRGARLEEIKPYIDLNVSKIFDTPTEKTPMRPLFAVQEGPVGPETMSHALFGGTPILKTSAGQVVMARYDVGKGSVVASTTDHLFSDLSLGGSSHVPDTRQIKLFHILYDAYRRSAPAAPSAMRVSRNSD